MAVLKCKMCGGDLVINESSSIAVCEYCGTQQTVPNADNEKKLTLFQRANRLRFSCEFDKAAGIYETIVAEFPEEAEAYWGLLLCKYGIEYVDDPATAKKIPTCHRSSFESVMDDSDFEQVMENADVIARGVYRQEAKQIEELRKRIIEVSSKEEPYDIFICYKETAPDGDRTIDSVIAQDVYDALTEKGYRVFFSRITLEDKLGQEYEPYIFAALNSAKIMLAFGTDYEYYNAVWVKNEWSRFLQLIAKGEKKTLIPCYKNIDAYDMPKEFAKLQAQDMGKVGAVQDLLRGIEKILPLKTDNRKADISEHIGTTEPLIKRAFMFLRDGEFERAEEYFERVLDTNPENAFAYYGKLLVCYRVDSLDKISVFDEDILKNKNYVHAKEFADEELLAKLAVLTSKLEEKKRIEEENKKKELYSRFARLVKNKAQKIVDDEKRQQVEGEEQIRRGHQLLVSRERIAKSRKILDGWKHLVGLRIDGTVMYMGANRYGECNVSHWRNVKMISCGTRYTIGLRSDGRVLFSGDNCYDLKNVTMWNGIKYISAGERHIAAVRNDGRVVACGENNRGQCNVQYWKDIKEVEASWGCTIGLKTDGTVVAVGENDRGKCDVSEWKDIIAISAYSGHTVGLKSNGTVVACGINNSGQCDVAGWRDIVEVATGFLHTVGLKSDGTVVATGSNAYGQCNVETWRDVVSVVTVSERTIGIKKDGTLLVTGKLQGDINPNSIAGWRLFSDIDNIEQERNMYRDNKRNALMKEQEALRAELSGLKGLFSGKRRKEIETRLKEINDDLLAM